MLAATLLGAVCGDDRSSRHGTRDTEVHRTRKPGCPFTRQLGTASRSLAGRRSLSLRPMSACATAGPCAPAIRAHDHCQQFNVQRWSLVAGSRLRGCPCICIFVCRTGRQSHRHWQLLSVQVPVPVCGFDVAPDLLSSLEPRLRPRPRPRTAGQQGASRVAWPWDLQLSVSERSLRICSSTQPPSHPVS